MCSLDNPKPHAEIQYSTYSNCQDPSWSATLLMAQRRRSANTTTSSSFSSTSFAASSTSILTMPPKAVTPWFRLFHGYITTAALQHAWNPSVITSSMCRLCQQDTEASFHFFVSCPLKLNFWFSIFKRYSLLDKLLTVDEIWSGITYFVPVNEQTTVDTDVLCFFGSSIATIWKYHWRCVFDDTPWYTTAVVNYFELEHGGLLSSLSFERKLSSIIDT
ncbi:hypothetical protein RMATCC62417_11683 [Rhizopus microsporus]|nr:hypothetical protein RMATCC62417_11683 [Rhizopus microsporus]